jgi:pilus assembly protein CpaF
MKMLSTPELLVHCEEILGLNLGEVYAYLQDPQIQEVMINHPKSIWIERSGNLEQLPIELTQGAIENAITNIANINKKSTSEVLDSRLPGLRIAATLSPISHKGPSMCIRKHSAKTFSLEDYVASGAFSPTWPQGTADAVPLRPADEAVANGNEGLADFLRWVVNARHNIIVTGSTSAGKTTLLNAIAAEICKKHRVGTIEDTAELKILVPNHFGFEANANYGIDIRTLVKHALRYRPTRIIVGEVRGAEAFDMLDAYNTGHPGSMVSFHSDTANLSLYRLENMVRMAPEASNWPLEDLRRQIAATFKFVIHASVVDGNRAPQEVIEVLGIENGNYKTRSLFKKTH